MTPIFASKRGFATILAALRLYAEALEHEEGAPLWDIASDAGAFSPMTQSEVESMIEELNQ